MEGQRAANLSRTALALTRRAAARQWFLDHKAAFDAMDDAGCFSDSGRQRLLDQLRQKG